MFLSRLTQHLRAFCQETCIHGLPYLVSLRSRAELLWWAWWTLCGCVLPLYMNGITLGEWMETPLVWQIAESPIQIEEVAFPTVTICPQQV